VNCGYKRLNDGFDAKFHRSLVRHDKNGCLYAATALLHDIDSYWEAPGGVMVKYDVANEKLEKIALPMPHNYIQMICLDQQHDVIYGVTFNPERMLSYDLNTRVSRDLGPISSGFEFTQAQNVNWMMRVAPGLHGALLGPGKTLRALTSSDCASTFQGPTRSFYFKTGLLKPARESEYVRMDGLFNFKTGRSFCHRREWFNVSDRHRNGRG
jgi:hypothetical protein